MQKVNINRTIEADGPCLVKAVLSAGDVAVKAMIAVCADDGLSRL